ncbi:MAG: TIGR02147 family protein [Pseudobdellovibrionaceae bacterium]
MAINTGSIYDYKDYRLFLISRLGDKGARLGRKGKLAEKMRVQPAYLSLVLKGKADLSLEQADLAAEFFGFSADETHFFILLVQRTRAGSKKLKDYFSQQIEEILKNRMNLVRRLGEQKTLSPVDQAHYYSAWYFGAIHMATTVPALGTRHALNQFFRLPLKKISEVLEFLIQCGLVVEEKGVLKSGSTQIRLGRESVQLTRHHSNMRVLAVESLEREETQDLHYSAMVSLSESDAIKVKDLILETLKSHLQLIRDSKEETVYAYNIDFFSLKRE